MSSPLPKTKRKRRILVVDNEYDITFTLKKGLENCGMFEVGTFNDPQEALSSLTPDYYDFLLIDIIMPHMSDYDLYDNIKKIDSKVKSCFISAYAINYQAKRTVSNVRNEMLC